MGAALLATLEDRLGPLFDAATRAAWAACLGLVAGAMRRGAGSTVTAVAAWSP